MKRDFKFYTKLEESEKKNRESRSIYLTANKEVTLSNNVELLRSFWRTEEFINVKIKLILDPNIDESNCIINMVCLSLNNIVPTTLKNIYDLYNEIKNEFKNHSLVKLSDYYNLDKDGIKALRKKIEFFLNEVLNDLDLMSFDISKYFNWDPIKESHKLAIAIKESNILLNNFTVKGEAIKAYIGIHNNNKLIIVKSF